MEKITWTTEKRRVVDLIPADYNPRTMTDVEREYLAASIHEFNEVEPVVINTNNHVIGGHQRIKIYADLGREEIDVRVPSRELTIEEEVRLNVRLNKNVGQWDYKKLKELDLNMLLEVGWSESDLKMGWGTEEAEGEWVDPERLMVLEVLPPESPRIRERARIHMETKEDYDAVKKAVEDGRISSADIMMMI